MPPKKAFTSIIGGKHHRSKEELKDRKEKEIKIGDNDLVLPVYIKKNKIALKKWKELVALYKSQNIEMVTSADSDLVAQYCICYSELLRLITLQDDLEKSHKNAGTSALDIIDEIMKIDNMIHKKREAHSKLASKLLLDPVSRVRAIPLEKPKDKKQSPMSKFRPAK